jgi:DMSO/TMAO reductase YedYZ molybdopterin-dependent catalytic subunit
MTAPPEHADRQPRHPRALIGAAVGLLAAAAAIGAGQFASGLGVPQSSPVLAVGQAAIDLTPLPVKDFAISAFGANDKTALLGGILVILAGYAAVVGILAVRRLAFGLWGLAVFACIGVTAALSRPDADAAYVVPTLVGAATGAAALAWLARAATGLEPAPAGIQPRSGPATIDPVVLAPPDLPAPAEPEAPASTSEVARPVVRAGPAYSAARPPGPGGPQTSRWPARRRFLVSGGVTAAAAAAGTLVGRNLTNEHNIAQARAAIRFPRPAVAAPRLPAGTSLNVPGITPFITSDATFYRVDTALLAPQFAPANWQLRIHGMVQREVTINYADLLRRPLIEAYVTLTCVSDPVDGPYAGNAKWLGAKLADLIRQARPLAGANQLLSTSIDGYTSGTPLQVVLDGRNALLAVAMNDAALPVVHGFPLRLRVRD